ncbi:MAG: anti-sigma factor family protein [Chloroflexota bacterium]
MAEPKNALSAPCAALEENLMLYHYGDLDGVERATLQKHLQNCVGCSAYLRELGALLPLTIKTDQPPPSFWSDFNRELRQRLDNATEEKSWRRLLAAFVRPRLVPVFAAAAVIALALTFTLGKNFWPTRDLAQDDAAMMEELPVAENLEFFSSMDLLDNLDLLESMGSQDNAA